MHTFKQAREQKYKSYDSNDAPTVKKHRHLLTHTFLLLSLDANVPLSVQLRNNLIFMLETHFYRFIFIAFHCDLGEFVIDFDRPHSVRAEHVCVCVCVVHFSAII